MLLCYTWDKPIASFISVFCQSPQKPFTRLVAYNMKIVTNSISSLSSTCFSLLCHTSLPFFSSFPFFLFFFAFLICLSFLLHHIWIGLPFEIVRKEHAYVPSEMQSNKMAYLNPSKAEELLFYSNGIVSPHISACVIL